MWAKASKLDVVYRKILLTKFFTKGWGSVEILKRICEFSKVISDRSMCKHLVDRSYPIFIDKNEKWGECRLIEGHFLSPFAKYMKGIMPKEVETARFQFLLPLKWSTEKRPVCIHLAGTGDHGFWRRRTVMARPLLKEHEIASIILENPFYGLRKPKEQLRSSLHNVSDLFVMGGALILETLALLHWCEKEGYGPLGVSGVSMGGHMATLAATNWHKPLALIPCLSWSNATPIFTQGVMSGAIPWKTLASEYVFHSEYEAEILRKLMKCPQYDAFRLGQEFAVNFPDSIEELGDVKLKSGFGSAKCNQTTSASTSEMPSEKATSTSGLDQESLKSNSGVQAKVSNAIYTKPDLFQSEATNVSGSYLSSDQTHRSITTDESTQEVNTSAHLSDSQSAQTLNSHPVKGIHTRSMCNARTAQEMLLDPSIEPLTRPNQAHADPETTPEIKASWFTKSSQKRSSSGERSSKTTFSWTKDSDASSKKSEKRAKWNPTKEEYTKLRDDALHFMEGVMDTATFVGNFSKPVDPELVFSVLAKQDAYIPWHQMQNLAEMWPGIQVRYINAGHVSAVLFQQHHFRTAINDAFKKMEEKYNGVYPEES
ncbi:protein ABHD18-like [Asterias amurensis]|uniref:protein ABHD18-like n=1 Tax=Asterias amurensis TaxID=7602 RepID=UPI003AB8C7AC